MKHFQPQIAPGAILVICAGLLLAACSNSQKSEAPVASAESVVRIGPCGGLTASDAAAILHIPPTEMQGPRITKDPDLEAAHICWYRDSKNIFKSVNFSLSIEKSAAAATRDMNGEKQNFATLAAVAAVKNLGDEAWCFTWRGYGPAPRLLMRKGNIWLDVRQPEDEASQTKIAEVVLKNLSSGR